jgi:hypothetical protein
VLQGLVELIWHKRGRKLTEAKALSDSIGINEFALAGIRESLLEAFNQARIKGIDLGL